MSANPYIEVLDAFTVKLGFRTDEGKDLVISQIPSIITLVAAPSDPPLPAPSVFYIELDSPQQALAILVVLTDPLVCGAQYTVTYSNGIELATGEHAMNSGTDLAITFVVPDTERLQSMKSLLPTAFQPNNPTWHALLATVAHSDEEVGGMSAQSATQRLKLDTTLISAETSALDRSAYAFGLSRPLMTGLDADDFYSHVASTVACRERGVLKSYTDFMDLLVEHGKVRDYKVWDTEPNEVTIEYRLPLDTNVHKDLDQHQSSYLHADETVASTNDYFGDYLYESGAARTAGLGFDAYILTGFADDAGSTSFFDNIIQRFVKAAGIKITYALRS